MPRDWKGIVVHCSDSTFGDNLLIDAWHKERKWNKIGYHFVITNGKLEGDSEYFALTDGQIQQGRSWDEVGAHAPNYNSDHLGICMIGKTQFTQSQMKSLAELLKVLVAKFNIDMDKIIGHYECTTAHGKTCPNFDVRKFVNDYLR